MIRQQLTLRQLGRREPPGHLANEGDTAGIEIEDPRCHETPDDQDKGAGDAWRDDSQSEDDHERGSANQHGRQLGVAQRPEPGP